MKHLIFLWTVQVLTVTCIAFEDPGLTEDVMSEFASTFSEELKNVPKPMLREALRNALPKMQERLVDYSMKMYASGKGKDGAKPNPMLIGFSMGMNRWSNYLSKLIPLLNKGLAIEPNKDSDCLYDGEVCYVDEADSHPCCDLTVSCVMTFHDLLSI